METVKGQPSLSDARNVGFYVDANRLDEGPWTIASPLRNKILDRLNTYGENLGEITSNIFQGIRTSANDVYVLEVHTRARNKKTLSLYSRALDRIVELEREPLWPLLRGEEIKRYTLATPTRYVLVPYEIVEGRASLIFPKTFRSKYPLCWNYLSQNKAALKDRERGRMDHEHWYGYIYPKNLNLFSTAKIVTPDIASRASFALDSDGSHSFVTGYGIILNPTVNYDLRFILGLLNSKALDFYLRQISTRLRGGFYRYFTQFLKQLPIRHIDFSNPQDRRLHDRMVELVKEMLDLQKRRTQAPEGSVERAEVERRIGRVDREIDELVYKLYGITEEEQKVIEG